MFEPIDIGEFEKRTGNQIRRLHMDTSKFDRIVSLREVTCVELIVDMPKSYLYNLLRQVTLQGSSDRPYVDAGFKIVRTDPNHLAVGQTFVQRPKYQRILESLDHVFTTCCHTGGYAKLEPHIIFARNSANDLVIAHYVPPIVEINSHNCLLDGVHRNYAIKGVGTTGVTITIKHAKYPFPCTPGSWDDIKVVDEKPKAMEDRYRDLKPELFRDLKWVGVDG